MMTAPSILASEIRVDVNVMPRVVFTGDSQTCGRVGAVDYPQMLSWEMPIRVINTAVGGTNTNHLLREITGGSAHIRKGEKLVVGTKVGWHAGPYPGQKIRLGKNEYVIDRIEVVNQKEHAVNLRITEPAKEDFDGTDYSIEAGWRVRVAERKPDYACFMYSVNDSGSSSEHFLANIEEIATRTRSLGAQPIFLSGVPLMDAAKGGSHPGINARVSVRARDLAGFCREKKIPFGDVFGALMALDVQATSVWADTVHPTTDGSMAVLNALRHIMGELGLAANPYYVRGYRAAGKLSAPGNDLVPFTTSQPDYDVHNRPNDSGFGLEAIRVRDEYGLIAFSEGNVVESETRIVLEFGVGDAERISSARAEVVAPGRPGVSWYDWKKKAWSTPVRGRVQVTLNLSKADVARACRDGAVWLALTGDGEVQLDYAALFLKGRLSPYKPRRTRKLIVWPRPGDLDWNVTGSLIPNGDLTEAHGDSPAHWKKTGDQALYLRSGVVAKGTGRFIARRRVDLFKSAGQKFTRTVRPLDALNILNGTAEVQGKFLVAEVMDHETLRVRRYPKAEVGGLDFEVTRSSGCAVVPGGCMLECRAGGRWTTRIKGLKKGHYRLGFFHRAFDPTNMNAKDRPGRIVSVAVAAPGGRTLAASDDVESSYQWQRTWLEFDMAPPGDIKISLGAGGEAAMQYTGFTLHRR